MTKLERILGSAKDAWIVFGITLLLLVLLEAALSLAFFARSYATGDPDIEDYKANADVYSDSPWVHRYRKEFHESNVMKWVSYVYWRRQPYRGDHINVDSSGIRRSWAPATRPPGPSDRATVFMFGGSTMWGAGARDDFTIPSILAKQLAKDGRAFDITNFGEAGYVSTQEVIALLLELQKGNIPDIVIFYDGFNDTYSAYQQRVAGLPLNEPNRAREFNLSTKKKLKELRTQVLRDMVDDLSTIRFSRGLVPRWRNRDESKLFANQENAVDSASTGGPDALGVLATYRNNVELVKALAGHYGFRYLFYWQPTIFHKTHLTEYEESERKKLHAMESFFLEAYDAVRQSGLTRGGDHPVHDISRILSDVNDPLYMDFCHLGEPGNELIARRMATDVVSIMDVDALRP